MAGETTKSDIRAVHDRIDKLISSQIGKDEFQSLLDKVDKLVEGQTQLAISFSQIKTVQEMTPQPVRPCPEHLNLKKEFDSHVLNHKETLQFWQRPLVSMIFDLIKMGIVFVFGWLITRKF